MNRLADEYGTGVEERGENLKLQVEKLSASCHLDSRKFSFITIKLKDESLEPRIMTLLNLFKEKEE